jgi:hypothetical protein
MLGYKQNIRDEIVRNKLNLDPKEPIEQRVLRDHQIWTDSNPKATPSEHDAWTISRMQVEVKEEFDRSEKRRLLNEPARSFHEGQLALSATKPKTKEIDDLDDLADRVEAFYNGESDKWLRENAAGVPDEHGGLQLGVTNPHEANLTVARDKAKETEKARLKNNKLIEAKKRQLEALERAMNKTPGADEFTILIPDTFVGEAESTNIVNQIRDPNS